MSRLMRMAYGHGGTRLERTLVSSHHQEPVPTPLRLKLLLLAVWITVPALVSLYAIPKTSMPMKTVIDISRLSVKPPPELGKLIMPEPKPVPTVEQHTEPPPKPLTATEQAVEPPRLRQTVTTQAEEAKRPSIARATPADLPDLAEQKLQAARERKSIEAEVDTNPAPRLRRGALPGETATARTAASRARSAATLDEPVNRERAAVVRRQTAADASTTGSGAPQQRMARSERAYASSEETSPRGVAARERSSAAGVGNDQTAAPAGVTRGVSLMSLEICSGSQQQEAAIKAILAIVGTRQSCRNEKGEFQFRGTKRISSFNLMIVPSKGRRLSNRCEELEDAYQCLKNN
jgi:hypothetical protein